MTEPSSVAVPVSRPPVRQVLQALAVAAIALLAYEALRFYLRDPVHYMFDYTQKSFGVYWPHRLALLCHIAGGTLALFFGPFQLWSGLRRWNLRVHRVTGYLYIAGVAVAGAAAFYLGFFTQPRDFGIALWGLATAWWITVGMAFLAIRRRQIPAHREWMIRGYVVTFAFVAFRWAVDLPIFASLGDSRFATVGWLCWVLPLLIAEVFLQWRRTVGVLTRG